MELMATEWIRQSTPMKMFGLISRKFATNTFEDFKKNNPEKVLDNMRFLLLAKSMDTTLAQKNYLILETKKSNYFENGFTGLINFDFRNEAKMNYEALFSKYNGILQNDLKGNTVMNYVSSHDDSSPYDKKRKKHWKAAQNYCLPQEFRKCIMGTKALVR